MHLVGHLLTLKYFVTVASYKEDCLVNSLKKDALKFCNETWKSRGVPHNRVSMKIRFRFCLCS